MYSKHDHNPRRGVCRLEEWVRLGPFGGDIFFVVLIFNVKKNYAKF